MKIFAGISFIVVSVFILFSLTTSLGKVSPNAPGKSKISISKNAFVFNDPNPFTRQAIGEFESFIKMAIANKQAPGAALAIVKDTSIIFLKGYGLREIGKTDSINPRTIFRIGSVSKSVPATLAAILVSEGV